LSNNNNFIVALFNAEEDLVNAIRKSREKNFKIFDALSPYPIHGLEDELGYKDTRLHTAGFLYGATGLLVALGLMTWISTSSWPTIFGGKPYFSLPAFIPIAFELTVLFCAVGMVLTFLIRSNLGPGAQRRIYDKRITDDKFALVFKQDDIEVGSDLEDVLKTCNLAEIDYKEVKPSMF